MTDAEVVKLLKARLELARKNGTNMVFVTPKERERIIQFLDGIEDMKEGNHA